MRYVDHTLASPRTRVLYTSSWLAKLFSTRQIPRRPCLDRRILFPHVILVNNIGAYARSNFANFGRNAATVTLLRPSSSRDDLRTSRRQDDVPRGGQKRHIFSWASVPWPGRSPGECPISTFTRVHFLESTAVIFATYRLEEFNARRSYIHSWRSVLSGNLEPDDFC